MPRYLFILPLLLFSFGCAKKSTVHSSVFEDFKKEAVHIEAQTSLSSDSLWRIIFLEMSHKLADHRTDSVYVAETSVFILNEAGDTISRSHERVTSKASEKVREESSSQALSDSSHSSHSNIDVSAVADSLSSEISRSESSQVSASTASGSKLQRTLAWIGGITVALIIFIIGFKVARHLKP